MAARRMTITSQGGLAGPGFPDQSIMSHESEFSHQRFMPTSIMIVNDKQARESREFGKSLNFSDAYTARKPFNSLTLSQELPPC
mmetsp:Transcript_24472/g.30489  ORF Transcript_24472/g.30489 Transcript_24472/m.30489 type:complete len:84 (+) Transcript_24472:137-388(+)|eukprot:CAMPEP_0170465806 /NCGR_PEP_ID=MMETSP0123-20130129/10008_1 /TAXON_ID=182087 /ORGANISM="Favella ehrenbergii, Strain Fehren 1" /LENGTH=83 /DNA_ID=CAMNT_0010731787 /DNA_START=130 /DNA_END=381 /DNA_ORIENTATION=+